MIEVESYRNGTAAIRPAGSLDWITSLALRHAAGDLLRLQVSFVVDLARTSRLDAIGASALLGTMRQSAVRGVDVRIINPRPAIQRQLELFRIDHLLLCPNLDSGDDAA